MFVDAGLVHPIYIHKDPRKYDVSSLQNLGVLIMKEFFALNFYTLAYWLGTCEVMCEKEEQSALISSKSVAKEMLLSSISSVSDGCNSLELRLSKIKADNLKKDLNEQSCTFEEMSRGLNVLHERIFDELGDTVFFHLSVDRAKYFREPWLTFGQRIIEVFPSIIKDVEEAGKCYATKRNTACVFHIMRIMEVGLHALANKLEVPTTIPNWDGILKKIETELQKKFDGKSPDWLGQEAVMSEAAAHLRTVKTAWRNPTMHVEQKYTDEEALDIYNAVRVFMGHLAEKL